MNYATVSQDGTIGQIRLASEKDNGSVPVPHYAHTGDLWNGGDPLKPDGTPYTDEEKSQSWDSLTFLSKFTPEEESIVRVNAPYIHTLLLAAHEVNSKDTLTQYAFAQLVAAGIFTQERVNEVLEL